MNKQEEINTQKITAVMRLKLLRGHFPNLVASVKSESGTEWQTFDLLESKGVGIKLDYVKDKGWGYKDTEFVIDDKSKQVGLTGSRYAFSGQILPNFREWAETVVGIDMSEFSTPQKIMDVDAPILNDDFLHAIKSHVSRLSFDQRERIMHSHGQSLQEIYEVRNGKLPRCIDAIIYPISTEQVEVIVKEAVRTGVCLVPYGGGTNVTHALICPENEKRMMISVDMTRMNHVKWVDKVNMTASIEAGIIGIDMENELKKYGVVSGHEPDSIEFSSLGGWVSTRASGMKKNVYGNIEDILVSVKIVTPLGTYVKTNECPRTSNGPDLDNIILGHEGSYGIITEVILRVRPTPQVQEYGSVVFPDFESGCKFMQEVSKSRIWPASCRLVDNLQFQFGVALKPQENSKFKMMIDKIKKYYILKIKGFDANKMCAATLLFEGTKEECKRQQKSIYSLAVKNKGLKAGSENGQRGYFLTYVIAYLRDFAANYSFMAESFETSVPWSNVQKLCENVNEKIVDSCRKKGVEQKVFVSFRVT